MKLSAKPLTATVVATLLLLLTGAPASAASNTFDVTDGELQLAGIGTLLFSTYFLCSTGVGTITSDIVDTGADWSSSITALTIPFGVVAGTPSAPYIGELVRDASGGNTGTISGSTNVVSHSLRVFLDFYAVTGTPPSNCARSTRVCRLRLTFATLVGPASALPNGSDDLATGDTITLSGTGTPSAVFAATCTSAFTPILTSPATIPATDPMELTTV